jgi:hypothetical protein
MKKIVLALVVLVFAAPALADVNITAAQVPDSNEVIISWVNTDSVGPAVRAFGINVQLDNDANVVSATGLSADYWVYPGTIQIAADGTITFAGSIAAEESDLPSDTLPGPPDGNGVTLEAASLYAPVGPTSPNKPALSGDLASIIVDKDCQLCISANVSRAGATGVVMEDPAVVATVTYSACIDVNVPDPGVEACYTGTQTAEWGAVGEPGCWCKENHVAANPRQCLGDAVGDSQGRNNYWTSTNDLTVLIAAWNKPYPDIAGQVEPTTGTPLICADFDHLPQGRQNYRVSANDLGILIANWNQNNLPGPNCP